ncbi:MAG: MCP four helix bundle domain-containing protein, partial [Ignavibacteriales bacterium]|nr:MCP four helix bundle domain-containing protein [Ignavibacteriales bacterium]
MNNQIFRNKVFLVVAAAVALSVGVCAQDNSSEQQLSTRERLLRAMEKPANLVPATKAARRARLGEPEARRAEKKTVASVKPKPEASPSVDRSEDASVSSSVPASSAMQTFESTASSVTSTQQGGSSDDNYWKWGIGGVGGIFFLIIIIRRQGMIGFSVVTKSLGRKIGVGFTAVVAVLVVVVLMTMNQVNQVKTINDRIIEVRVPTADAGLNLLSGVNQSLAGLRGYMLLGNDKFKDERRNAWDVAIFPAMKQLQELSRNWTSEANKQRFREISELVPQFQKAQEEIEAISKSDSKTAKEWLGSKAAPTAFAIKERLQKMVSYQRELVKSDSELATHETSFLATMLYLLLGLGIAVGAVVAFVTTRGIVRP